MSELKDKCASKTTTTVRVHTTSRHVPQTEGSVLRSLWPAPSVACPGQRHVRRMRVIATGCGHTRQARAYSRLSKNSIHCGALSQQRKSATKKEVIDETRKEGKTVHVASLMDICHLKNSELETNFQKLQRPSCTPR